MVRGRAKTPRAAKAKHDGKIQGRPHLRRGALKRHLPAGGRRKDVSGAGGIEGGQPKAVPSRGGKESHQQPRAQKAAKTRAAKPNQRQEETPCSFRRGPSLGVGK